MSFLTGFLGGTDLLKSVIGIVIGFILTVILLNTIGGSVVCGLYLGALEFANSIIKIFEGVLPFTTNLLRMSLSATLLYYMIKWIGNKITTQQSTDS